MIDTNSPHFHCRHDSITKEYRPQGHVDVRCDTCGELFYDSLNEKEIIENCEHPAKLVYLVGNKKICVICGEKFPEDSEEVIAGRSYDFELEHDPQVAIDTMQRNYGESTEIVDIFANVIMIIAICVIAFLFIAIITLIVG